MDPTVVIIVSNITWETTKTIVFGKWERGFRTIRSLQQPHSDLILESSWWIIISVENSMICIAKITMLHSHFAKSIKIHFQFLLRLTTGRPLEAVQVPYSNMHEREVILRRMDSIWKRLFQNFWWCRFKRWPQKFQWCWSFLSKFFTHG